MTKFQGDISSISGVYKIQEGRPVNQLYVITVDRIVRDKADLDYVQSLVDRNPDYFATYQRPSSATSSTVMPTATASSTPTTALR